MFKKKFLMFITALTVSSQLCLPVYAKSNDYVFIGSGIETEKPGDDEEEEPKDNPTEESSDEEPSEDPTEESAYEEPKDNPTEDSVGEEPTESSSDEEPKEDTVSDNTGFDNDNSQDRIDDKDWLSDNKIIIIAILIGTIVIAVAVIIAIFIIMRGNKEAYGSSKDSKKKARGTDGSQRTVDASSQMGFAYVKENATSGRSINLEVKLGKCNATSFILGNRLAIGSDSSCDIVFNEPSVEGIHAFLETRGNDVFLVDNSKTGTYLEGMRINSHNRLDSGDLVSLGDTEFILRF